MTAGRARALVAAVVLALAAPATAQPDLDAGVGVGDAGVTGDAGPARIIIDGPTLLGIGKPQVSASAAPTELRLGDKLTLFVEVVFDEHVTVSVPAGLDLAPAFDELKRSSVDERRSDGTRKRTYQIQLQAWELGDVTLPPIQVTYSVGGDSSWVVTNEVPLRIVGSIDAIDDPNALLPETPPLPLVRRNWLWVYLGAALATIAVVALVAWVVARRRRRRQPLRPARVLADDAALPVAEAVPTDAAVAPAALKAADAAPPRPPVVRWLATGPLTDAARRALAALDALERAGTLRTDQPAGYRTMVGIVRTYLLAEFALPSHHRTSGELVAALRRAPIAAAGLDGVAAWLRAADLVKFAAAVDADDGAAALAEARRLIVAIAGARPEAR